MQSNKCRAAATLMMTACGLAANVAATAQSAGAFLVGEKNLSPVALLFALEPPAPDTGEGWRIDLRTASHALADVRGNSSVLFDGETSVASIGYTTRLSKRLVVSAELPYVWHTSGELDGFIDDWHSWFGFPDGIRDEVPRGQLRYTLRQDGVDVLDLRRNSHGVGDLRLRGRWALGDAAGERWSLAFSVKLPSGDADKLTGSGAIDAGVMLNWQHQPATDSRWSFEAGIGGVWLGNADVDFAGQNNATWTAQAGASWRAGARLTLGARLQGHGGLIDNAPAPIGDASLMLVTGGSYDLSQRWQLRITVSEDIKVDSAPDVTFRLGLARRLR